MRKLAAVLILLGPILLPQEGFSEQKVALIECPLETKAKVAWSDKIGEDPTYSRQSPPDEWIIFGFKKMEQVAQKITCQYEYKNGTMGMTKNYEYTAKRKIRSCKKVGSRTIDCTLE